MTKKHSTKLSLIASVIVLALCFSMLIGTLIGFLMGIYMPVGNLPEGVQWIVKLFPCTYSASALRTVLMEDILDETFSTMPAVIPEGYDGIFTRTDFEHFMGVNFEFGDYSTNLTTAIIVMVAAAVIFSSLSVLNVGKKNK